MTFLQRLIATALANKAIVMATFAEMGNTGLYAPIRATVGTVVGTVSIRARHFAVGPRS